MQATDASCNATMPHSGSVFRLYEDLWDIFLLAGLFCIGWSLFPSVSRLCCAAAQLCGDKQTQVATQEQEQEVQSRRTSDDEPHGLSQGDNICDQKEGVANMMQKDMTRAEINEEVYMDNKYDDLLSAAAADHIGGIARNDIGGCRSPLCAPHGDSSVGDKGPHQIPHVVALETQFKRAAAKNDLARCLQIWKLLPYDVGSQRIICNNLASVLSTAGAKVQDAESSLQIAESARNEHVAAAALMLGARLHESAWVIQAGERLWAARIPLNSRCIAELSRACCRHNRGDLVRELWFEHHAEVKAGLGEERTAQPLYNNDLYSAALETSASTGDFQSVLRIAQSTMWKVPSTAAGHTTFLALVRWLAKRHDIRQAFMCWEAVQQAGGRVDFATIKALLNASARAANMSTATNLFNDLIQSKLMPDFSVYSVMIRGFCSVGSIDQAMNFFNEMRSNGIAPDALIFDTLLDCCASRNLPALADTMLSDMQDVGVRPSNNTLAILLRFHGRCCNLTHVLSMFEDLPRCYNFEANAQAYGELIEVCLRNGKIDLALEKFTYMLSAGCLANSRTYQLLVDHCLLWGYLEKAATLVETALNLQYIRLEQETAESVLRLCVQRGKAKQIGKPLLHRLREADFQVSNRVAQTVLTAAQNKEQKSFVEQRRVEWQSWQRHISLAPSKEDAEICII